MATQQSTQQQQAGAGMRNQGGNAPNRRSPDTEVEDMGGRKDGGYPQPAPDADEEE